MKTLEQIEIDFQDALAAFRANPRGDTIHRMANIICVIQGILERNKSGTKDIMRMLAVIQRQSAEVFAVIAESIQDETISIEEAGQIEVTAVALKKIIDDMLIVVWALVRG